MGLEKAQVQKKAKQWIYDYDVPIEYDYKFNNTGLNDNPLMKDKAILKWATPFVNSGVPKSEIMQVINKCMDIHVEVGDLEELEENTDMVISWGNTDADFDYDPESVASRAGRQQLKKIEQDINKDIDEKKAMNTALRTLYAEVVKAVENGTIKDEDNTELLKELRRMVETKSKVEGDLVENETNVHIGDMVDVEALANEENSTSQTH